MALMVAPFKCLRYPAGGAWRRRIFFWLKSISEVDRKKSKASQAAETVLFMSICLTVVASLDKSLKFSSLGLPVELKKIGSFRAIYRDPSHA